MLAFAERKCKDLIERLSDGGQPPSFNEAAVIRAVRELAVPGTPLWLQRNPQKVLDYDTVVVCFDWDGSRSGWTTNVLPAIMDIAGIVHRCPAAPANLVHHRSAQLTRAPPSPVSISAKRAKTDRKKKTSLRDRYRKTMVRYRAIITRLRTKVEDLEKKLEALTIRQGRYFNVTEGMDMALRAAMSNQAANSIGLGSKVNLHSKTCIKWELQCHASLIASMQCTYKELKDVDYSYPEPSCNVHVVACDATNSLVWQQTKIHNLEVHSIYPLHDFSNSSFAEVREGMECTAMFADMKPLSKGSSAPYLNGTILAQLKGVGAPTWRDNDLQACNHMNIWIFNTDAGGDIASCRRRIEDEVADKPHILILWLFCLLHQYHLMTRTGLATVEHAAKNIFNLEPGYWSRLSSIMVMWREKARKMHTELLKMDSADPIST